MFHNQFDGAPYGDLERAPAHIAHIKRIVSNRPLLPKDRCDSLPHHIAGTGGATFYAGANSTDGTGNTGWSFTACPAVGGVVVGTRLALMGVGF